MTGPLKWILTAVGLSVLAWALLVLLRPEEDFDESDWDDPDPFDPFTWDFLDEERDDWTEDQFQYLFDDHGREL